MNNIKYEFNEKKTIKQGRRNGKIVEIRIDNYPLLEEDIKKIFNYDDLEKLEIINCNFSEIPDKISKLSKLKELNLEKNNIVKLPSNIKKLQKLEILNLCNNNIAQISEQITSLINLKKIDLSFNHIGKVPISIEKLYNLENINLANNDIQEIPEEFINLSNLKEINFYKNENLSLNEKFLKLDKLESLNLGYVKVKKIFHLLPKFCNLKKLNLEANNITEFFKELLSMEKLEILILEHNEIKEIPNEIINLKSLKVLNLKFNMIDKVSEEILNLNLNEFYIEDNPFMIIPEMNQISDINELLHRLFNMQKDYNQSKTINLSELGLMYAPDIKEYFKDVENLDLSNNLIQKDLENLKNLKNLKKLYLEKNQIEDISGVLVCDTLEILNLNSNKIKQIPKELSNLRNLQRLDLRNNFVSQIKGLSLKQTPKEIIDFLLLNQNKELIPLNEAKLLVVGDENSGKSSLVERMVHNKFDAEYNSTKGIDISNYFISDTLKVNIWDFAGQEITYQIHNLFMSKESLYLLVIDGQKEDNIVENFEWLETISANADNPPILIVVTKHENNRSHQIDEDKYREEFLNIVKIHYVSSKENFGFFALKEDILLALSKFSQQKIPKNYEIVKNKIEDKRDELLEKDKYMLSAEAFEDICDECKLLEERDNVRTVLNDIGVLIGFNDDEMHVVNPTKMIDKIYEIIRSKEIKDNGKLDLKKETDRHYTWIIEFLLKNKIAFKIDDSKVMIPSRLTVKRPDGFLKSNYMREDKVYGLNFRYRYKRFKKSIFFEFLIQAQEDMNEGIVDYWANGITWKYNEFQALVLASKIDRTISIHISKDSTESRKFLTKIRKKLDEINSGKWGIIQEVAVVDNDENTIYYKSYQFLKAIKDDTVILDIKGSPKPFEPLKLLDKYKFLEEDTKIPLIITEGKTDWKHLKKALVRFQDKGEYLDLIVEFKEFKDISMSDSELDDYAQAYAKEINERRIICIFDRDLDDRVKEYGQSEFVQVANKQQIREILTGKELKEWDTLLNNNVYAMCIPKISDELDEICVEFYYKEEDLKREDSKGKRLFTADEFKFKAKTNDCNMYISNCGKYKTDSQSGNNQNSKSITLQYPNKNDRGYVYKIDEEECVKSKNMNLSKNDFADNIYDEVEGFDDFNIENFRLIFDVIKKIVSEDS